MSTSLGRAIVLCLLAVGCDGFFVDVSEPFGGGPRGKEPRPPDRDVSPASSGPTPAPSQEPDPGWWQPGAAFCERARLYVDRPAQLTLDRARPPGAPATPAPAGASMALEPAADLSAVVLINDSGALLASRIRDAQNCGPRAGTQSRRRTVPTDHATIQAALDASAPGDEVLVLPGVYRGPITLKSDVRLLGSGAWQTTLDGEGKAQTLVDYTGARNTVIQGFTLRGVGRATRCGAPDDPFACGWYAAAIYGDGHNFWERHVFPDTTDPCADSSILVTQNIIRDNFIGMMPYFHAPAVVRNNVFVDNEFGLTATYLHDHALIVNNVFVGNRRLAVGARLAFLDVVGNLFVGSEVAVTHDYVKSERIVCNGFVANGTAGERVTLGENGNLSAEQAFVSPSTGDLRPTPALIAALAGCLPELGPLAPWLRREPGAFGGVLGNWSPTGPR